MIPRDNRSVTVAALIRAARVSQRCALRLAVLASMLAAPVLSADQATLERGQKEESRSCLPCHSLRLVHSQRLSKTVWNKELDKMTAWGTKIQDREALLEYLAANFGDDKPPNLPAMTADGSGGGRR